MNPLVTFPDPEAAVVAYLKTAYATRVEAYKPDVIDTAFPAAALPKTPMTTQLQVELEAGGVADYPVTERAQVRVTCHAPRGERAAVKDLASLTLGLLTRMQSAQVAGVFPRIGRSDVITDPDTKNLMCWFVVRVDLKATVLAS